MTNISIKPLINALTLALLDRFDNLDVAAAKAFATQFVEENTELFTAQVVVSPTQVERRPGGPTVVTGTVREDEPTDVNGEPTRAVKHYVPVVGADGLTDVQRAAMEKGIGLCPNCQQPKNRHLPGCARASGEDPKAVTKTRLPAVQ